ncbi:hypothetical protein FHU41_001142 [Psychromicrobium silvestre]|uniref:Cobalamin-independent synthase, Catalytic domain n=1 Tax=Psychromicrobium silvestre TaxID=1645614 RepID=A0A7Y9LSS5_9MICC|nr:hypothetical protein [Psychromicrobium silvestre]NYE94921.1 hypothetical protein [Psychromicrobium silvestre]
MTEVTATSLGSWPGSDLPEAIRVLLGELGHPQLPSLPYLPARGAGSELLGRTAAMLTELPVDLQSYGWRLVQRPGADQRRASSLLASDINILADTVGALESPLPELKTQLLGPLSLAAGLHLPLGERTLIDVGARRDIAQSLAAGVLEHLRALQPAVPGARMVVQLDEPEIVRVLGGAIPTVSGYRSLRAVNSNEVRMLWNTVIEAAHAAGADEVILSVPAQALDQALGTEVEAVAVTDTALKPKEWELLAGAIESGRKLWLGIDSILDPTVPTSSRAQKLWRAWREIGLESSRLAGLRLTEAPALAIAAPTQARAALGRLTDLADALGEFAEAS